MIYALLSQNFVVRIYALFPQIFLYWKAESADVILFWMYAYLHFAAVPMYHNLKQLNPYPSIDPPLGIVKQCWYFHFRLLSMQRANDALKTSEDFSLETGDSTPCFSIHKTLMFNNKTFSAPKVYSMSKMSLITQSFHCNHCCFSHEDASSGWCVENFWGIFPWKIWRKTSFQRVASHCCSRQKPLSLNKLYFLFHHILFVHFPTSKTDKVLNWRTQTALCSIEVYTLWGFTKFTKLSRLSCFIQSRVAV